MKTCPTWAWVTDRVTPQQEMKATDYRKAPYRDVRLPPVRMERTERADGSIILRSREPLAPFDPLPLNDFLRQARRVPDKPIYAQRARLPDGRTGDWRHLTFAGARRRIEAVAQWLRDRQAEPGATLLILSGNSIAHAVVRLGAMAAGVTVCPVSANYSLLGAPAYERLNHVLSLVQPRFVFAETGGPYADALAACDLDGRVVITREPGAFAAATAAWDEVLQTPVDADFWDRVAAADPDAPAAYMLTSGSTGVPKAVIQTQRMLATNLHQAFQVLGQVSGWDDVMLDWLPWSHVSGAFNLLAAAVFGGTLYIDEGKPLPGLFDETLRNLHEISVPYFCNVPAGFAVLVDALEADTELRHNFFRKLRMVLYGAAGLPQALLDRLQTMAVRETGCRVFMTTGYGATETASGCMVIHFDTDLVGIGLPLPGLAAKLVPLGDRYELRLRGDNIMPGYLDDPEATAAAFDAEGFYRTGDAVRFHDENDVTRGLYFAGRLSEEFKLANGTWVRAGQVRAALLEALAPALVDLLLCGRDRDCLAVLGVANPAGLREIAGEPDGDPAVLATSPRVQGFLRAALARYNADNPGRSARIARLAFLQQAPDAARNEVSDKGTLNQLLMTEHRPQEIDALYATEPGAGVLVL